MNNGQFIADEGISRDSLFDGDLQCLQTTAGYRFSVDAVLLAHFVRVRERERILEMGAGCGIIILLLLYRWGPLIEEIVGIELQKSLVSLARKNLEINGFTSTGRIVEGDIKDILRLLHNKTFDTIICNPPFFPHGSGRQSSNPEACLARHQILASLDDFLLAASQAVRNKGSVYFIYPATQTGTFVASLEKFQLTVKRLQFIYSYPQKDGNARLVLIECTKNGGDGAKICPPFYIYQKKDGDYSPEMQKLYK
ncbi:MAG: methyltransferase [Desulforhopalus sp.]|nr:methyltransferase [Desulforhopalus sp.]